MKKMLFIKKIVWYCKTYGVTQLVAQGATRLRHSLLPYPTLLFVADCPQPGKTITSFPENVSVTHYKRIQDIPADDFAEFASRKGGGDILTNLLKKHLTDDAQLWLIKKDEVLAGYHFTMMGEKGPSPTFPFFPRTGREPVLFAGEVFPGFRGRSIGPTLIKHTLSQLGRDGATHAYCGTFTWNTPSIRCLQKTDFYLLGRARHFKLFGRHVVVWGDKGHNTPFLRHKDVRILLGYSIVICQNG